MTELQGAELIAKLDALVVVGDRLILLCLLLLFFLIAGSFTKYKETR